MSVSVYVRSELVSVGKNRADREFVRFDFDSSKLRSNFHKLEICINFTSTKSFVDNNRISLSNTIK